MLYSESIYLSLSLPACLFVWLSVLHSINTGVLNHCAMLRSVVQCSAVLCNANSAVLGLASDSNYFQLLDFSICSTIDDC